MPRNDLAPRVESAQRFNCFYTRQIGALSDHILKSQFSLAEASVIYELAQREKTTATELCGELGLDAGYLSQMLATFKKRGLIATKAQVAVVARYLHNAMIKREEPWKENCIT